MRSRTLMECSDSPLMGWNTSISFLSEIIAVLPSLYTDVFANSILMLGLLLRPQLKLNRLGLVPSPTTGLIGLHGAKSVFGQVMDQLERSETTVENLWKRSKRLFKVQKLAGEGLDDAGGGYSEIMSHMMKELLVDHDGKSALPLLIRTPNGRSAHGVERDTVIFNPEATLPIHMRMFRFLGLWMGVAVRTDSPIELPLAGPMWGLLLGRSLVEGVEEDDAPPANSLSTPEARAVHLSKLCGNAAAGLKEIDEFAYQEVKRVAELPEEWLGVEDMTTSAEFTDACGKLFAVLPNDLEVTAGNRLAFVTRCLNVRGHEFDRQVAAVRAGMAEVLPMPLMSLVSPTELNDMVCGDPDFDVARLKDAVRLESYSQSSDQIIWLWEVLEGFTAAEKSMFLRFCGGFTRLPHDLKRLPHRFEVHKMRYSNGSLPESATCFFTLKLPQYRTMIELRDKLKVAIYNCGAIDTDGRGGEFEQMPAQIDHEVTAAAASRLSSVESLY